MSQKRSTCKLEEATRLCNQVKVFHVSILKILYNADFVLRSSVKQFGRETKLMSYIVSSLRQFKSTFLNLRDNSSSKYGFNKANKSVRFDFYHTQNQTALINFQTTS